MIRREKNANESFSRRYYNLRFTFSSVFYFAVLNFFHNSRNKYTYTYCYWSLLFASNSVLSPNVPSNVNALGVNRRRRPFSSARIEHDPKSRGTYTISYDAVIASFRKPTINQYRNLTVSTFRPRFRLIFYARSTIGVQLLNWNARTPRVEFANFQRTTTINRRTRCRFLDKSIAHTFNRIPVHRDGDDLFSERVVRYLNPITVWNLTRYCTGVALKGTVQTYAFKTIMLTFLLISTSDDGGTIVRILVCSRRDGKREKQATSFPSILSFLAWPIVDRLVWQNEYYNKLISTHSTK